jgi:DNA-directed RNA polymerase subunit K/omega
VIHRPDGIGAFEFSVLSALRAGQLMRGCLQRVDGDHKSTVIAQVEVAAGKVTNIGVEVGHANNSRAERASGVVAPPPVNGNDGATSLRSPEPDPL